MMLNKDSQHKKVRSAPLSIQFEKGKYAFVRGWIANPYDDDKDHRGKEWQRGFNTAYFEHLEKVKVRHGT